jgi:transposase
MPFSHWFAGVEHGWEVSGYGERGAEGAAPGVGGVSGGEADRARAILLTLAGWRSAQIAEVFRVREDTVRFWRGDFLHGGVEALKASVYAGPPPVKTEAALRVVTPLLEAPVADRPNWTIPRLIAEIKRQERVTISPIHVSKLTLAALDARKHWLKVEWLPKYAPELNDIEVWHDLKAHHLAHKTFTDAATLDQSIHAAVDDLNSERSVQSLVNMRISA